MVSRELLFLEKARALRRVLIFLVIVGIGLGCESSSPPSWSWSVGDRLVDLFVGETDGLGRELPVATIGDDTRYVLRKPHSEPLLWTFVHDHKEAGVIHQKALVPGGLWEQSELVIFPRLMITPGEWIVFPARVASVSTGPPPSVDVDFEAPANPTGRRVELIADASITNNSELKRIEIPPVVIESGSELRFSMGMVEPDLQTSPAIFSVQACVEIGCEPIFEEEFDPTIPTGSGWRDRRVSLEDWTGKNVTFRFEAEGSSSSRFPIWPVWANPTVYRKVEHDPGVRNVILLSIDTLRADHLSSYGYQHPTSPFIDERFARQGTVFDHPIAAGASTSPAHASIFTAVDVATHRTYDGFHAIPAEVPTLPELVRAAGVDTASYNENGWLSLRTGFSRGFDRFVENRSHNINSPSGQVDRTFDAAAQWLRENRDTPFFLFLHTYQVHTPYAPPEKYKNLFAPPVDAVRGGEVSEELVSMAEYDREIRYTDDELRRLFETIDELDLGRDTVVILTSDHGEAFLEHGVLEHGTRLDEPVLRVPLMFWGADIPKGQRIAAPVGQIDFLPTILEILGVSLPTEIQGRSLAPLLAEGWGPEAFESRPIFSQARAQYALLPGARTSKAMTPGIGVRLGNMKLARYTAGDGTYVYEYYDVLADPGEKNDLLASRPEEVEALRAILDLHEEDRARFREEIQGLNPAENKAGPLSPDQESKLRALGYIE